MPWKECHVMDERLRFVARRLDGETMTALCEEFGISRKTGYKIFGLSPPRLDGRRTSNAPVNSGSRAHRYHVVRGGLSNGLGRIPLLPPSPYIPIRTNIQRDSPIESPTVRGGWLQPWYRANVAWLSILCRALAA